MIKSVFDDYSKAVIDGKMKNEDFANSLNNSQRAFKNFILSMGDAKLTQEDFNAGLKGATMGFGNLSASISTAMKSMALNMGVMIAVSLAIKGLTWLIDEAITTQEELEEKATESVQAFEKTKSEIDDINGKLKENN